MTVGVADLLSFGRFTLMLVYYVWVVTLVLFYWFIFIWVVCLFVDCATLSLGLCWFWRLGVSRLGCWWFVICFVLSLKDTIVNC